MKEIFLLENPNAYAHFLAEKAALGYTSESILGVGTVSSYVLHEGRKGLKVHSVPAFFSKECADGVVDGKYSAFNFDPIFFVNQNSPKKNTSKYSRNEIVISRWIFISLHLSFFQMSGNEYKNNARLQELYEVESLGDLIQIFMENLFLKIQEVRSQSIIFFFDTKMFYDYVKNFLLWISSSRAKKVRFDELKNSMLYLSEYDLQKKITHEFLWYLADCALHPSLAVYPTTSDCFEDLIAGVRALRKGGHLSDKIIFKI